MKPSRVTWAAVVLLFSLFPLTDARDPVPRQKWVTGYYAGWMQGYANDGHLTPAEIDYSAMTHIIHFALVPQETGEVDPDPNGITEPNSRELLARAHAAGRKVILSVGGANSADRFRGATSAENCSLFTSTLINFMTGRGYDGLDIDWEVLEPHDSIQFIPFITRLRTLLDTLHPRPLLTAAAGTNPLLYARLHTLFDQINVMTYDMAGPWSGWVTWYNSPLYDGGYRLPYTKRLIPSADALVRRYLAAGVPAEKIGLGISFYGTVWYGGGGTNTGGVTKPRQAWSHVPEVEPSVPYHEIMEKYYRERYYKWDSRAGAAYLSIDKAGSDDDIFISFDSEYSIRRKIDYAYMVGLGGVFIWEIGGGYLGETFKRRDRLLQAVKRAHNSHKNKKTGQPQSLTTPSR